MTSLEAIVLFGAAALAGIVNSVAGGGSVISFPALVWSGIDPVVANVTNTIALTPGSLASASMFRREIRAHADWLRLLALPSLLGSVAGASLLLLTPARVFADLVPWLILLATATFALQETITRAAARSGREARRISPAAAVVVQLAIATYGGYFGAGIGIMMLATLGFLGLRDLHGMIAVRNALGVVINIVASAWFVARGHVDWPAAAMMTAGQVAGGFAGATLARRVSPEIVRGCIVAIGIGVAASFFLLGT